MFCFEFTHFPLNAPHTGNQAFKVLFWKLDSYEDKLTVCLCVVVLFQTVSVKNEQMVNLCVAFSNV